MFVAVALCTFGILFTLSAHAQSSAPTSPSNLPAQNILNADGTINLRNGNSGRVDLSRWAVSLDPRRGPIFSRTGAVLRGEGGMTDNRMPELPLLSGTWSALNNGVNQAVHALAVSGSNVYVGGNFTRVCGDATCTTGNTTMNHLAQWNGSAWSAVGNGVNGTVYTLVVSGSNVYVGGDFTQVCGNATCNSGNTQVNYLARWNGSGWSAIGNGVNGTVFTMVVSGSNLYVGGYFSQVCGNSACNSGNTTVNSIAQWNGSNWSAFGSGVSGVVRALVVSGSNLYVGGGFSHVCGNAACNSGDTQVNYIARWNGSSWAALGNGLNNAVNAFALNGSNMYVAGYFDGNCSDLGCGSLSTSIFHVAQWDGSNWSNVGNGVNAVVYALAPSGSNLYAGGNFNQVCGSSSCSGNTTANYVAEFIPPSPYADLSIVKTAQSSGGNVTYTLVVTNLGPRTASNVVVTDPLPIYVRAQSALPGSSCTLANNKVTCNLATLNSGATFTVTITASILTSSSGFTNCASVSSDTPDPSSQNNTSCD